MLTLTQKSELNIEVDGDYGVQDLAAVIATCLSLARGLGGEEYESLVLELATEGMMCDSDDVAIFDEDGDGN